MSSGGSCDVFWERASLALRALLLSALRAGELTDPGGCSASTPRCLRRSSSAYWGRSWGETSQLLHGLPVLRHFRCRRFLRLCFYFIRAVIFPVSVRVCCKALSGICSLHVCTFLKSVIGRPQNTISWAFPKMFLSACRTRIL